MDLDPCLDKQIQNKNKVQWVIFSFKFVCILLKGYVSIFLQDILTSNQKVFAYI